MSEPRQIIVEIDGQLSLFEVLESPLADEWPAGDPVPADKETLGYVRRIDD